jgi:hypothetical protein
LFDRWQSKKPLTKKSDDKARVGGFFRPHVILEELRGSVPRYLDEVDQAKLIYPACKRALSDLDGDVRSVWDHTRLEAMRYLTMVPRPEFELLSSAERQIEMMNAYLLQRPESTVRYLGIEVDYALAIAEQVDV